MTVSAVRHQAFRHCPLCRSDISVVITDLHYATFDDCPLESFFPWIICSTCGFSYYDTPSSAGMFDAYYRGNAYYCTTATAGSGGSSPQERKRMNETAQCIRRHVPDLDSIIFDVGSGKGGFLSELQSLGYNRLHGIDMQPACVEFIVNRLGIDAQEGPAEYLPFKSIIPDCLIYSHVLEHALAPQAILAEAWNRLGKNGIVYIEVPDASRYGEFTSLPYIDLYLEHINHFDLYHLIAMMVSSGFEVMETGSKTIEIDGGSVAPCIFGVFSKKKKSCEVARLDSNLADILINYNAECQKSNVYKVLEETAASGNPIYIWGISQYAQLLIGQTALGRCSIKSFIDGDSYKQTKAITGRHILSPEELKNASAEDLIVLTGINYREQMRGFLREIHFPGQEIVLK